MRDSPALDIVPALMEAGARVQAYDPEGMEEARRLINGVDYCAGIEEAMAGADALVVVTEWNAFRSLDPDVIKAQLKAPVVIDLRNIYSPDDMRAAGIRYHSIGRPEGAG